MSTPLSTQVLIIGAGPVGLSLAKLLGVEGVDTVLVERHPGCVPEPRAIGLDGESMRTYQAAGVAAAVAADMNEGFVSEYFSGDGTFLFRTDLRDRPFGYCMQNAFDQPRLERTLLEHLGHEPSVSVRHNTTLLDFEQDVAGVTARLETPDGQTTLKADFLVACDGGRSSVRTALNIPMQGDRLPQKWLVIDTVEEGDHDLPECRFYCDPARPAMTLRRPYGERRWEWMLMPGETDEALLDDARIRELLGAHTDPDRVRVYRKCVYGFSAVVAERFSEGRVFLAGDAAHMTPPFAGQGLNSGVRDARNLAWKLAWVLDERLPATVLDSYDTERREHARRMVNLAVGLGDRIQPIDATAAAERDAYFAAINADDAARAKYDQQSGRELRDVRLADGWFDAAAFGGRMILQPALADGSLLDDHLGPDFVALAIGGATPSDAMANHPLWQQLSPKLVDIDALKLNAQDLLPALPDEPAILLLRPDRIVLARLDGADSDRLDRLRP
ncbi:MAG: bifunctional 3-(3-hydroxy-phenyl)propionate/3-hydroxycinnamic acid hydroxylase [Pseudomonadales bacterium]